ncbi:MAG: T9SS type A sorting domain-containing protein [Chlorobi bacterium]|nr:T9SS type A sorting domain-containing protein [Chlorobiota bacterium]
MKNKLLIQTLCICMACFTNLSVFSQYDTIQHSRILKPYNVTENDKLKAPLTNPIQLGDINGDGLVDFVIKNYVFNPFTEEISDKIICSVIVTDLSDRQTDIYLPGKSIEKIGDYNGDGYDDFIENNSSVIYFGNQQANNFDSLQLQISTNFKVKYIGDFTGDGIEDFIISALENNYPDSLLVVSNQFANPVKIDFRNLFSYIPQILLFDNYDYDNDSTKELVIIGVDMKKLKYGWFSYDSTTNTYVGENLRYINTDKDFYSSFPYDMSDINGDGHKDVCLSYYDDDSFKLGVFFYNDETNYYYDNYTTVDLGIPNRLFYNAGDFNNDGADDWYTSLDGDTLRLFLGNPDIKDQGFNIINSIANLGNLLSPPSGISGYLSSDDYSVLDYNNDGYSDLLFKYWEFDENESYKFFGPEIILGNGGLSTNDFVQLKNYPQESFPSRGFGALVKNIGDINDDSFEDLAILESTASFLNIYYGNPSFETGVDMVVQLPQYPFAQCRDFAFGDLNNDGQTDLAVSFSSNLNLVVIPDIFKEKQKIYVFYGIAQNGDTVNITDADVILEGKNIAKYFGSSMAVVNNYNNDGYRDLFVGGGNSKNGVREIVYFPGGDDFGDEMKTLRYRNPTYGQNYGSPTVNCGDINNDGYDDLMLGDPRFNSRTGHLVFYFGGPQADSLYDFIISPEEDVSDFGRYVAESKGDYNNDGFNDIAVKSNSSVNIYYGGAGFDNDADIIINDTSIDGYFTKLDFVDAFSKKGQSDILISMSSNNNSEMYVFKGGDSNKSKADYILPNKYLRTYSVAAIDFNKDGYTEIISGNPEGPVDGIVYGGIVQIFPSPVLTNTKENITENQDNIIITPNPARNKAKIFVSSESSTTEIVITLMDINGRKLTQIKSTTNQDTQIDLSNLSSGIYLISVENTTVVKKLIKQ